MTTMENKDITIKMHVMEVTNFGGGAGSKASMCLSSHPDNKEKAQGVTLELRFDTTCPIDLGYYELTLRRVE